LWQSCGFFAAVKNIFGGGYFCSFISAVEWLRKGKENFRLSKTLSKAGALVDVLDF